MKKAIITGASSGLGLELGKQLKQKGFKVINISISPSKFENMKCDLNSDKDINLTLEKLKDKYSNFELIILNAGVMPHAKVGEINFNIDDVFKVNVTSNMKIINGLISEIKKSLAI